MFTRVFLASLAALGLALSAAPALAQCKAGKMAELPVTMIDRQPVITAQINGKDAQFVADSGAFYSMISRPNAEKYALPLTMAPFGFSVRGVNGEADVSVGTAKDFTLAGIVFHHVEFLVGGGEAGDQSVGFLGQNVFRVGDVEYDLANGVIRLFHVEHCSNYSMAYWVKPDQAYSFIHIEPTTPLEPHTKGDVYVNGVRLTAMFDTGAGSSILTLQAAARAGIKPNSPDVVFAGREWGIGKHMTDQWIAPIASFKIGDEEIQKTHLRLAKMELAGDADMLLGADFFLSHRVFVANSQHTMYFSYNGGKVFSLEAPTSIPVEPATTPPAPAQTPTSPAGGAPTASPPPIAGEPTDAAGYSRRGAAYTSRRQLDKALADLNRAVQLAPTNADYVYQRAMARLLNHQPLLAMADLDQALKLRPDDVDALILRGDLKMSSDKTGAIADFDAADKAANKLDDARFALADGYAQAGDESAAIGQFDLWITAHGVDARMAEARNGRCWSRALLGQQLDLALADCNTALRLQPHFAEYLDSRGLVFLRQGQFDRSVRDYDEALKLDPKSAWSLYGRGLAKLNQGKIAEGQADIAAAVALDPKLPENAKAHGVSPPPAPKAPTP